MITIKQLRQLLENEPNQDAIVILSCDDEGTCFALLSWSFGTGRYVANTPASGHMHFDEEDGRETSADGQRAVVLWRSLDHQRTNTTDNIEKDPPSKSAKLTKPQYHALQLMVEKG